MIWLILVTSIINFLLGLFVLSRSPKRFINRIYFIFASITALWVFNNFILRLFPSTEILRGSYAMGALVLAISLHWVFYICDGVFTRIRKIILYTVAALLFVLPYIGNLVIIQLNSIIFGGVNADTGILFPIYSLYFFGGISLILYKFYSTKKKSIGLRRLQMKYLLTGAALYTIIVFSVSFFLPLFGILQFTSLDNLSTLFFVGFTAYAIAKYRFMDIRVIIKRSTVFAVLVAVITGLYTLIAVVIADIFGFGFVMTGFIMAILVALGFDPLKRWLSETTDRWLFKGEYKPQILLNELGGRISTTLDIRKIFQGVLDIFEVAFHPAKQAVLVSTEHGRHFSLGEAEGFTQTDKLEVSYKRTHPLISFFKKHREVVVAEEYGRRYEDDPHDHEGMKSFIKDMDKRDVAVYVPLHSKDKLIGLLLLGNKKSGDIYNDQDIRVLDIASSQVAVAIENARLYEEMKDFNLALQREVEKATKQLHHANEELKQLDRAKSEFISIASHQLRTPMTIIKGYISMLLEGSYGNIPKEEIEPLKKVFNSNNRLIALIESLLNISRIESGRLKYEFTKMDLSVVVDSVVDELGSNAEKKGLELIWKKLSKALPKVTIDAEKIRQVVLNLLDNAVKYTPKGKIEVSVVKEKNNIVCRVKDTGLGMSREETINLFKKFSRGRRTALAFTGGTGLGLYVGRMMVEVHGGKIWAESKGANKGSTFAFSLPLRPGKLPKLPKEGELTKEEIKK